MPSHSPLFFGPKERPRYGCYHPGSSHRGVLICAPLLQEYMRAHWACRQLATMLSERGVHVLRFDYQGSGDSAGDSTEMSVETLREDVTLAIQELRDMSGAASFTVVALRGGLIAAEAAALPYPTIAVDGIVSGSSYISQLETMHSTRVRARPHFDSVAGELLGTLISPPFRSQISTYAWTKRHSTSEIFIVTSPHQQRSIILNNRGEYPEVVETKDITEWDSPLHFEQALIIPETLRTVTERVVQS